MKAVVFPEKLGVLDGDETILQGYGSDAIYTALPSAVVRPATTAAVQEILAFCNRNRIEVTACGNQTSMTGSSVTHGGLILSGERLPGDWQLYEDPAKPGRWLVDAGPSIFLGDLQEQLAAKGFFYPPDPTSRNEARLGATIATNASGEDTYKYGATRRWVRGLTYVKADGSLARAERPADRDGDGRKNTCGYPIRDSEIDLLIGSEGTLGVIVEATLEVLPEVPRFFAILFFLPTEEQALEQVHDLHENPDFSLRCLEYMDEGALGILAEKGIDTPDGARAALYAKQEFGEDEDERLEAWYAYLENLFHDRPDFMDHVHIAGDAASQDKLRRWRHFIPATINERAGRFRERGGGKVGTDWHVPVTHLEEMFRRVRQDQDDMDWVVFGHIGNGHPHFNFITRDAEEYRRGRDLLLNHCRLAVSMGGGVSGEHGLGKLKTHLLECQYSRTEIREMLAIKKRMDPNGILGKGNIFPASE